MGRVLTNNTGLQYAIEQSLGVLPGSPEWFTLEPNSFGTIGAEITTVARNPISKNRQRRKGTITDLDSQAEFNADLTLSHFVDFAEGFVFANFRGAETYDNDGAVDGTGDLYNVVSGSVLAQRTLVYARGYGIAANNGLKVVDGTATATTISVFQVLEDEATPPSNATVEVAGFRTNAGDLAVSAVSGNTVTITSAANVFISNGLDLVPGAFIYVGGSAALNQFSNAENSGYARVVSVDPTGASIVIDKTSQQWVVEAADSHEVDVYMGRFLRNVPVDDADFLERSFQFEIAYENLAEPGPDDEYEYSKGNYCNTLAFNLPLTDKATIDPSFVGTDTTAPTGTRATNAATPVDPSRTDAFNTTQDCARLRITDTDENGLTTDFKNLTLTLNNNVSPEKVLCFLGARFMNYGNFEVDLEAQVLFTDGDVVDAIRNNDTVALDFGLKNDDGAIFVEIPAMTLGNGAKDFPLNESVNINLSGQAFADPTLNTSIGMTAFAFIPEV